MTGTSKTAFFTLLTTPTKITLLVTAILVGAGLGWTARDQLGPLQASVSIAKFSNSKEVHSDRRSAPPTTATTKDGGLVAATPSNSGPTVSALKSRLAERDAELDRLRVENQGHINLLEAMLKETHVRGKAGGNSIFSSVREAGAFMANINRQSHDIHNKYPRAPPPHRVWL